MPHHGPSSSQCSQDCKIAVAACSPDDLGKQQQLHSTAVAARLNDDNEDLPVLRLKQEVTIHIPDTEKGRLDPERASRRGHNSVEMLELLRVSSPAKQQVFQEQDGRDIDSASDDGQDIDATSDKTTIFSPCSRGSSVVTEHGQTAVAAAQIFRRCTSPAPEYPPMSQTLASRNLMSPSEIYVETDKVPSESENEGTDEGPRPDRVMQYVASGLRNGVRVAPWRARAPHTNQLPPSWNINNCLFTHVYVGETASPRDVAKWCTTCLLYTSPSPRDS